MSIFDINPAGAFVDAIGAAAKNNQRRAVRHAAAAPKGQESNFLVSATAHLRHAFARTPRTPESVHLVAETELRTV